MLHYLDIYLMSKILFNKNDVKTNIFTCSKCECVFSEENLPSSTHIPGVSVLRNYTLYCPNCWNPINICI